MKIIPGGAIINGMIYCGSHCYSSDITREVNPEDYFTDYGWFFPASDNTILRRLSGIMTIDHSFFINRGVVIRSASEIYDIKYQHWTSRVIIKRPTLPVMLFGICDDDTVLVTAMLEKIVNDPRYHDGKNTIKFINSVLSNFLTVGKLVPWITVKELDKRLSKMTLKELPY